VGVSGIARSNLFPSGSARLHEISQDVKKHRPRLTDSVLGTRRGEVDSYRRPRFRSLSPRTSPVSFLQLWLMDKEATEGESLKMDLRSGLAALIQTCGRISAAT
jgi:hypothetical protein